MKELFELVVDQLRGAWRFRWLAITVACGLCVAGWLLVSLIPDTYEARATVFIDTRTVLSRVTQGMGVDSDVETQIQRVRQALLSAPQLDIVIDDAKLLPANATQAERARLVADLRQRIRLEVYAEGGSGAYALSFRDSSRDRALRVVEVVAKNFVDDTLGGKRQGTEQARQFLMQQIDEYEKRLADAESRLAAFKKENVGLMPGAQGDYFTRLQAEMESARLAESALTRADRKRTELQRQLQGQPSTTASPAAALVGRAVAGGTDTASRIKDVQSRLDELLLRFTDKHPDVIALRETLDSLLKRQQAELTAARNGDLGAATESGLIANPVFQAIRLELNQTDVEIASQRAALAEHQNRIAELRRLVNTVPEVEAQLARLNRNYDVTKASYQDLVARLDRASLSQQIDQEGSVNISYIDPPRSLSQPVLPNRLLLISLVLGLGLACGGGVAYLLNQIRPVFFTARQLAYVSGLPVLGSISVAGIQQVRATRHRQLAVFCAVVGLLAVSAFAVYALQPQIGVVLRGEALA